MPLTSSEINQLVKIAFKTRNNAFAFKSSHQIGACVLTSDGQYFGGCNTEGVISSMGVCAEMSAIDHAVAHGCYQFKAICVADKILTFPCGACLQYLSQFYQVDDQDIVIIAVDSNNHYETKTLSELLPQKFLSISFDQKIKSFAKKL